MGRCATRPRDASCRGQGDRQGSLRARRLLTDRIPAASDGGPAAIDLNADVGESYGAWTMGADEELIPLVTSVNIACGGHAGDPLTMERTVALARRHGAAIGAHPGYPDRDGFGRRDLAMTPDELEASIVAQLGALQAFLGPNESLSHVKAHGALYNAAMRDRPLADVVARAVRRVAPGAVLLGLPGSAILDAGRGAGLPVAAEGFADRAYEPDGSLRSRRLPGGILEDPAVVAAQAVSICRDGTVGAVDGSTVELRVDTLCIHGDTPGAPRLAAAVRRALEEAGITIRPLARSRAA